MPRRRERPRFSFAVSHHGGNDEIRIVERRAECVREAVSKLAALMDRSGGFRRAVAADAARKRELAKELAQTVLVARFVGINLAVRSLEIGIRECRRSSVARSRDVDNVEIVLLDETIEMDPHERLTRIRTKVAEQPVLHMFGRERRAQQRILEQIDHADAEIIGGAPVRVDPRCVVIAQEPVG